MGYLQQIRKKCLECANGLTLEIKFCEVTKCPLYPFRSGRKEKSPLTPLKAIRKRCLDCAQSPKDVKTCYFQDCPIYKYRMGTNPNIKRQPKNTPQNPLISKKSPCS